jgi:hypothetical protein
MASRASAMKRPSFFCCFFLSCQVITIFDWISVVPSYRIQAMTAASEQNERLVDNRQIAHAAIARFLEQEGYQSTLESFQKDAERAGWTWPETEERSKAESSQWVSLEGLIELHQSNIALEKQQRLLARRLLSKSPTELTLAGPSTLDFQVKKTHTDLHNSNILFLSVVTLPTRYFSTSDAQYVTSNTKLLCSTAADKRIVFSDAETGEMVEVFEPGKGTAADDLHSAAVLWTAQNPNKGREFVSCGMDGKVIVWDLLHRQPIQCLRHHTKFVVKCAFSPLGDYLASCSYDKTIKIYQRQGSSTNPVPRSNGVDSDEEADEMPPLLDTRYELVHTVTVPHNPESILFVRAGPRPSKSDLGLGKEEQVLGSSSTQEEEDDDESASKRTWLAYTIRSDSFVHYIALPMSADNGDESAVAEVTSSLADSKIVDKLPVTPDWNQLHFNTNQNRGDFHVSYSLMHMTLHPSGNHICIQTGDHSMPSTGYAANSSSSLSRILILPLLSSLRSTTLWTGVESSGFATIRHEWLPDGSAAWITSEEGFARLVDTQGKIRAKVSAHGSAAEADDMRRAATWTRGGNSLIKSLVVLDDEGSVATCGYDRTIRIISRTL